MPPPAPPAPPSVLSGLTPPQALELGLFALRILTIAGGAAAVFGLLFIPDPDHVHVEEDIKGLPGWRYSWNRDQTAVYLKYDHPGVPKRTIALRINDKDEVLDKDGRIVGKVVGGNKISIDTAAVLPDVVKQDEPRLCPEYKPDVPGSDQGKPPDKNRSRQYEDFVKRFINQPPTPSGFVYYLPNPKENGKPVSYDDCHWITGIMVEIKGFTFAERLTSPYDKIRNSATDQIMNQAERQVQASGGRPIIWIFAEEEAAQFVRALFDGTKDGRRDITVAYVPWTRDEPW